ncbi:MAG: hypothetical protein EOP41_06670 [Sphingobacteriaceae bacterium]|nr:MAG: hypothetical protein EOP41_06670 [Sphingobacteriaceae bacterium]
MLAACQQPAKQEAKKTQQKPKVQATVLSEEDQLINLIVSLEEVKRKSLQVKQESKGKRHLATYVDNSPTAGDTDYWVKVAEDNGDNYVTYYTFAVDKKTRQIRYYDVLQDSLISLSQWRKTTPAEER